MPGTSVEGKTAAEALIFALMTERNKILGEALLLANIFPIQGLLIGEAMLLALVSQTYVATSSRVQTIKGDLQWIDQ